MLRQMSLSSAMKSRYFLWAVAKLDSFGIEVTGSEFQDKAICTTILLLLWNAAERASVVAVTSRRLLPST